MTNPNLTPFRALIADRIHQAGIDLLEENGFVVDIKTGLSEDALCAEIGNYHLVIVRSATKITSRVIEHAFKLRVIARAGAGLDNVDVVSAKALGIDVVNAPGANSVAVAEHTMGLVLGLARHLPRADSGLKSGLWEKSALLGMGLSGKTLGIIGFGRIGREVARLAQAFGMKIVVNQRRLTPELALAEKITVLDLIDLLKTSDFVSVHVPLKPETKGLIGQPELAHMKQDAYLINTARGGIVDEAALLDALDEGRIAGAALDVFVQEPVVDSALARHPRVIATPHIAASTGDAQQKAALTVVEQALDILAVAQPSLPLGLSVLPLDKVFPHEETDPERVAKLTTFLQQDSTLKNPPVVTEWQGNYVVLDGATRVTALKQMNVPFVVAQVVSCDADSVQLFAWNHVKRGINPEALLQLLQDVPEITVTPVEFGLVHDTMIERGGLCYLQLPNGAVYVMQAAQDGNRLEALNKLVSAYMADGKVDRTPLSDLQAVRNDIPDMSGLIVFPEFTIEQILEVSTVGKVFPAGITRFVIDGRVLRINVDLERLRKVEPIATKTAWLSALLDDLVARQRIRYYQEPLYLLDE